MPGPTIFVADSYPIDIDSDNDDPNATFEVQHDLAGAPLLTVDETGAVTVYGPLFVPTAPMAIQSSTAAILELLDSAGYSVAEIDAAGVARFDGGLRVPVNAIGVGSTTVVSSAGTVTLEVDGLFLPLTKRP